MSIPLAMDVNHPQKEYPPEEWRIIGQLVRQIGRATTWKEIVEASDAMFHVQLKAASLRSEREAMKDRLPDGQAIPFLTCQGGHSWTGTISSCCPQCNRRASIQGPLDTRVSGLTNPTP